MDTRLKFGDRAAWCATGFLLQVNAGCLCVSDLNPERHIQNRFSRWEVFRLGIYMLRRAVSRIGW